MATRASRLLRSGNVVGHADKAKALAARAPSGLRFRPHPTPFAVVTTIASLERETLQRALARSLFAEDPLKIF